MAGPVGYLKGITILREFHTVLKTLTFPANPERDNFTPEVLFLMEDEDGNPISAMPDEYIGLEPDLEFGTVEWEDTGHRIRETFIVTIKLVSGVEGVEGDEALQRIQALADVVDAGFRDQTTGLPIGLTAQTWLLTDWRIAAFELKAFDVPAGGIGFTYTLQYRVTTIV